MAEEIVARVDALVHRREVNAPGADARFGRGRACGAVESACAKSDGRGGAGAEQHRAPIDVQAHMLIPLMTAVI